MVAHPSHATDRKRGIERHACLYGSTSLIRLLKTHKCDPCLVGCFFEEPNYQQKNYGPDDRLDDFRNYAARTNPIRGNALACVSSLV